MRMVKLSFNLSKRDFAWIGLIVVLVGLGFGYAYGGTNPAVEGHSVGEINFAGGFNVPSGNVGIGVPHPTQKLDVNGNVKANDFYIAKTGKWASSLGGSLNQNNCYWTGLSYGNFKQYCHVGYYVAGIKMTPGTPGPFDWDGAYLYCCHQ